MKLRFQLFLALCCLTFLTCSKSKDTPSVKSLLQNRWSIYNESTYLPLCSSIDHLTYPGHTTDFYQFGINDTLSYSRAGTLLTQNLPITRSFRYSLLDDNKILTYGLSRVDTTLIIKITRDSLILVDKITYNLLSQCTNTVVSGTAGDTSRLYR